MKKTVLVKGKEITLGLLTPGSLFSFNNTFAIKSDYRGVSGSCECYVLGTGDMFWGGTNDTKSLNNLVVTEIQFLEVDGPELTDNIPYVPFPVAFHTADVIAVRERPDGSGDFDVLLGRKPKQTKWQFIGGFVEPTHTAEHTAAKEFHEEAGLLIEDEKRFTYIGSAHIKDERYLTSPHQITTSLFTIALHGEEPLKLTAGDDLEEISWVKVEDVYNMLREQHKEIFAKFLIYIL